MRQLLGGEGRSFLPLLHLGFRPLVRRAVGAAASHIILAVLLIVFSGVDQARAELAITSFSQTTESGEWYLFEGQLSGTALE